MNLYIIRHGNTYWNTLGKIQGTTDIELDDKGIEESTILKEKIKDLSIDAFITSPLQRAFQTAAILNKNRHLPVEIEIGLKEINFGTWEGMTWSDVQLEYKTYILNNITNGYANPPNGETYREACTRISQVTDIITNKPYRNIAIITHRAVIRFMVSYLLHDSLESIHTFELPNTTVIKVSNEKHSKEAQDKKWRMTGSTSF